MHEMILLTKEQADKVRGKHGTYSELQPVPTDDGNFILPYSVLEDKEHAEVLDELLKCQAATIETITTIDDKLPVEDITRNKLSFRVASVAKLDDKWKLQLIPAK